MNVEYIARKLALAGAIIGAAILVTAGAAPASAVEPTQSGLQVTTDGTVIPAGAAGPELTHDATSRTPLPMTESALASLVKELGETTPVLSVEATDAIRVTRFDLGGYTLEVVEAAVPTRDSAGLRFDIDTRFLPRFVYVYLNRTDQQSLASGGLGALNVALCAIPGVGWGACAAITAAIQSGAEYIKAHGLCQKNFRMTFDFNSVPNNWITFACVA